MNERSPARRRMAWRLLVSQYVIITVLEKYAWKVVQCGGAVEGRLAEGGVAEGGAAHVGACSESHGTVIQRVVGGGGGGGPPHSAAGCLRLESRG